MGAALLALNSLTSKDRKLGAIARPGLKGAGSEKQNYNAAYQRAGE
jgi:hypothetical protein